MIRLGVVGYGGRIHGMVEWAFRAVNPEIAVVGVVDPNEAGVRQRLAERDKASVVFYPTLAEMVKHGKLDALAIGTRCNLHTPFAIEAAGYDLPLFLEKPVAVSHEQAQALEKAFEGSRAPVVVSFPLRVSPLCELAKQYIAEGAVSTPLHAQAVNYVPYGTVYWEELYRDYEVTGGLFLQKATHDFDYMMYLMGCPVTRIGAMWTRQRVFGGDKPADLRCSTCGERQTCLESPLNRKRHGSGHDKDHLCVYSSAAGTLASGTNEDCSSAILEFANGGHGVYSQVFYARRDAAERGATISGYMGTVSFDWYTGALKRVRHHAPLTADEKLGKGASHFGGDTELAHDFLGLLQGRPSRTPIWTGIQSVYTCLAARDSATTGQFVKVRQVGQVS